MVGRERGEQRSLQASRDHGCRRSSAACLPVASERHAERGNPVTQGMTQQCYDHLFSTGCLLAASLLSSLLLLVCLAFDIAEGAVCNTASMHPPLPPPAPFLVKDNGRLDGTLVLHRLETLGPLLQLERLVDDPLDLDLARVCRFPCEQGPQHKDGRKKHIPR